VLYVAASPAGAFSETLGGPEVPFVTAGELSRRCLASIETNRPLELVDLTGRGLSRIGADGRLTSGSHETAREWSEALFHHPQLPDGILYRSRRDPSEEVVAVFERGSVHVEVVAHGSLLASQNRSLVLDLLERYQIGTDGGPGW
jgi:RES domain